MSASFKILYHPDVVNNDIPRLSHPVKARIKNTVETKLSQAPVEYGEPLRKTLKGYWKLRVGDYRVIYQIKGSNVQIMTIGHRSEVYQS